MPQLPQNDIFNWLNSFNSETVKISRISKAWTGLRSPVITKTEVSDNVLMSIQPLKESDIIQLPEGERDKIAFKVYTKYAGIQSNDIITRQDGTNYQIKRPPLPWRVYNQLHHYYGFLYKVDEELLGNE